jgi:hypothetical protein
MSSRINVTTFRYQDHHFRWPVHLIHLHTGLYSPLRQNWHTYYRQPQQVLLISSTDATCFGRVGHPQTLKCTTLNKNAWVHFKSARSHNVYKQFHLFFYVCTLHLVQLIFLALAEQKDKTPWRWCRCIETRSTYDILNIVNINMLCISWYR